jgi:hypothetical protein
VATLQGEVEELRAALHTLGRNQAYHTLAISDLQLDHAVLRTLIVRLRGAGAEELDAIEQELKDLAEQEPALP